MEDYICYLFSHDISDGKALRRVTKRVASEHNIRIQKSVYEIKMAEPRKIQFLKDIASIVNLKTDSIFLIPLCSEDQSKIKSFGKKELHVILPGAYQIM